MRYNLADLRIRLNRFTANMGEQNAATVTTAQIDDWLRALELSPRSPRMERKKPFSSNGQDAENARGVIKNAA